MKPIEELRAAFLRAPPGLYEHRPPHPRDPEEEGPHDSNERVTVTGKYGCYGSLSVTSPFSPHFIAIAHNEFPAMLDEIERLRAEVEAQRERANSLMDTEAKLRQEVARLKNWEEKQSNYVAELAQRAIATDDLLLQALPTIQSKLIGNLVREHLIKTGRIPE